MHWGRKAYLSERVKFDVRGRCGTYHLRPLGGKFAIAVRRVEGKWVETETGLPVAGLRDYLKSVRETGCLTVWEVRNSDCFEGEKGGYWSVEDSRVCSPHFLLGAAGEEDSGSCSHCSPLRVVVTEGLVEEAVEGLDSEEEFVLGEAEDLRVEVRDSVVRDSVVRDLEVKVVGSREEEAVVSLEVATVVSLETVLGVLKTHWSHLLVGFVSVLHP